MELTLPHPAASTSATSARAEATSRRIFTGFLILVGTLSSTIRLKFGAIQYLEIIYMAQMGVLTLVFARRQYRATWLRPILRLGELYAVFAVAALALAVASLRFEFFYPPGLSELNMPVMIAIARVVELTVSVFAMTWLADVFRKDQGSLRFTMRVYFWTGVASGVYSCLCYPLTRIGIGDLGITLSGRFRGFYNEGGPWGLYLLSVMLVGLGLYRNGWEIPRRLAWTAPLLVICLFASGSKAAVLAMATLLLLNSIFLGNIAKRVAVVTVLVVFMGIAVRTLNLDSLARAYVQTNATYERVSHAHRHDGNYIVGRVAGAFIVPRMIAAHPYTGVGWGNYSLLRNLPEYRGAAAWSDYYDEPALGIIGMAAELGLPLTFFLLLVLFLPFLYLRRLRAPVYLTNLALLQPLVHLFGGQLNLTYPWIVTAFALGIAYSTHPPRKLNTPEAGLQVS